MAKYELKTRQNSDDVSAFLGSISDEQRRKDAQRVVKMMRDITGEKPTMWGSSIIGFGSYHYKYVSGHEGDTMKVGVSPRKNALTLYLMGSYDFANYQDLLSKLGKHKTGKACLYIDKLDDINVDTLQQLIKRSYQDAGRSA